jgi:hypothetical protein
MRDWLDCFPLEAIAPGRLVATHRDHHSHVDVSLARHQDRPCADHGV